MRILRSMGPGSRIKLMSLCSFFFYGEQSQKDSDSARLLSWFMLLSQTNAELCTIFLWSLPWPWPMQIEPEILHGTRGCNCILKKHIKNFRFWFRELTDSTFISITGLLAKSEIQKSWNWPGSQHPGCIPRKRWAAQFDDDWFIFSSKIVFFSKSWSSSKSFFVSLSSTFSTYIPARSKIRIISWAAWTGDCEVLLYQCDAVTGIRGA